MQLSHLVLRAQAPGRLAPFYEALGLRFRLEKHGRGPEHLAAEIGAGVLEIYPLRSGTTPTKGLRLGFGVRDLEASFRAAEAADGRLVRAPTGVGSGRRPTLEEPEGHIVDLVQL